MTARQMCVYQTTIIAQRHGVPLTEVYDVVQRVMWRYPWDMAPKALAALHVVAADAKYRATRP